jgi:hypothetical protein
MAQRFIQTTLPGHVERDASHEHHADAAEQGNRPAGQPRRADEAGEGIRCQATLTPSMRASTGCSTTTPDAEATIQQGATEPDTRLAEVHELPGNSQVITLRSVDDHGCGEIIPTETIHTKPDPRSTRHALGRLRVLPLLPDGRWSAF